MLIDLHDPVAEITEFGLLRENKSVKMQDNQVMGIGRKITREQVGFRCANHSTVSIVNRIHPILPVERPSCFFEFHTSFIENDGHLVHQHSRALPDAYQGCILRIFSPVEERKS